MKRNLSPSQATEIGDALILCSRTSFVVYAVGAVSVPGQEDFSQASNPIWAKTHDEATAIAKRRIGPGGKVYLLDTGTREWSVLSSLPPTGESSQYRRIQQLAGPTHHAQD
jgi:hypothetical protein